MTETVAVAHYPEGGGHATRMLGVARALEGRGAEVRVAGGGPHSHFVAANGYEPYEPTPVAYIDDFQGGSLADVLRNSVPASAARVRDYVGWLRRERPDAVVTDDMFAAVAARLVRLPLFSLTHNAAGYYETAIESGATRLWNRFLRAASEAFLYPAVWPETAGDPRGVTRVPPVALEPDGRSGRPDAVDVIAVPSRYSTGTGAVVASLREAGHAVTRVGGESWDPVPALLPWIEAADVVVCSGYSTVMEAAVAGTPCVVRPHTAEQRGFCRFIERGGVRGFRVARSSADVVAGVESPPPAPAFENGVHDVADAVLADLRG